MELGQIVATQGVASAMEVDDDFTFEVRKSFYKYQTGDWGDLCDEDKEENENALKHGNRVFASYNLKTKKYPKLWIITEWDRSVTTLLFPDEY